MTDDELDTEAIMELEQRLRERFAQVMNEPETMEMSQGPAHLKLAVWTALVNAMAEMTALLQERHGVDSALDDTTEKLSNMHKQAVDALQQMRQQTAPGSAEVN